MNLLKTPGLRASRSFLNRYWILFTLSVILALPFASVATARAFGTSCQYTWGTISVSESTTGLATDSAGNSYVGGITGGLYQIHKDCTAGWTVFTGINQIHEVVLDPSGNYVYEFGTDSNRGILGYKLDLFGNVAATYSYRSSNYADSASGGTADSSGNVYVGGNSFVSSTSYYYVRVLKFASSGGSPLWNFYDGTTDGNIIKLGLDSGGNLYGVGLTGLRFECGSAMAYDVRLMKFSAANGSLSQGWSYPRSSFASGGGCGISGNITATTASTGQNYIAFYTGIPSGGIVDVTTASLNSNGSIAWSSVFPTSTVNLNGISVGRELSIDSSGVISVAGVYSYLDSSANIWDKPYVLQYNAGTGSQIGSPYFGPVTGPGDSTPAGGGGIALGESAGYLYQAAYKYVSGNGRDYQLIKYSTTCTSPLAAYSGWTDPTITAGSTVFKVAHVNELRTAIDQLRTDAGLAVYGWTNNPLPSGAVPTASYVNELRRAIEAVYTACGQSLPTWTDGSSLSAGMVVKAAHITELRTAVNNAK